MLTLGEVQKVERVVCLITSLSPFVYLCICLFVFLIFVFLTLREEQRVEQVVCLITGLGPLG